MNPVNVAQLQDQHRTSIIVRYVDATQTTGDPPVVVDMVKGIMYEEADGSYSQISFGGLTYNQILQVLYDAVTAITDSANWGLFWTTQEQMFNYIGIKFDIDYQDGVLYGFTIENVPCNHWVWFGDTSSVLSPAATNLGSQAMPYMVVPVVQISGGSWIPFPIMAIQWGIRPYVRLETIE